MSDDLPPEPPPDPVPPEPNPDPVTMDDLAEHLSRTPEELAALDALADDPDAQALEALRQHLLHEHQARQVQQPRAADDGQPAVPATESAPAPEVRRG